MKMTDKKTIIQTISRIAPSDFDSIKIKFGNGKKSIGEWNKNPIDEISLLMFDLSLRRRITSITITDGGKKYPSYLLIGTSLSADGTTNIDADVIEQICLAFNRRRDAGFPLTNQYINASKEDDEEECEEPEDVRSSNVFVDDSDLFGQDLGMP